MTENFSDECALRESMKILKYFSVTVQTFNCF